MPLTQNFHESQCQVFVERFIRSCFGSCGHFIKSLICSKNYIKIVWKTFVTSIFGIKLQNSNILKLIKNNKQYFHSYITNNCVVTKTIQTIFYFLFPFCLSLCCFVAGFLCIFLLQRLLFISIFVQNYSKIFLYMGCIDVCMPCYGISWNVQFIYSFLMEYHPKIPPYYWPTS